MGVKIWLSMSCTLLVATSTCAASLPLDQLFPGKLPTEAIARQLDKAKAKTRTLADAIKNAGQPRQVKRIRGPDLFLKKGEIYFNGKLLKSGDSIEVWKKIIGGKPRCIVESMVYCVWDELGIDVGTSNAKDKKVKFFNLQMNFSGDVDYSKLVTEMPDGTPAAPHPDYAPHQVFPGYLEMNGYGIDKSTQFWEIRNGARENIDLHCGLLDCGHPHGAFGARASIGFTLNGSDDHGTVRELGISFDNE
jgi:hypothetical protein